MQPNHCDLLGQARESRAASRMTRDGHQPLRDNGQPQPSGAAPMRSEDSWIDVSSQPSSSSISSAATNEDIITTGLRVEQRGAGAYQRRSRRRHLQHLAAITTAQAAYASQDASQTSSSQEEYEESESESDHVLSSSNEDMTRPRLRTALSAHSVPLFSGSDAASSDDEDDSSTALGMGINTSPFVPQPNIFTHPPATSEPGWSARRPQSSVPSASTRRTVPRRESYPNPRSSRRSPYQHSPYNMISPSHHADHDAALRASLSTLLSCAAAARGLPKNDSRPSDTPAAPPGSGQPASFRLVGPSVAMGDDSSDEESPSSPRYPESSPSIGVPQRRVRAPAVSADSASKAKRRSSSPKDRGVASKKSRRVSMTDPTTAMSPTVMTWVISAGVVVLFSAISFSAGYMIGREVGRAELGMVGDGVSTPRPSVGCGQEAVRGGLRKLRWGSAAAGSASLAM
ncbi:hypothetical protein DTO013E5_1964 [Penicillium roqueforti]|uniref:Genomic scaffold, ProqFM164S02 n=1 Tax=Penicillium roqueforti (strain FM164) TaxID=1365484 RepID=W6QQI1_PENRF|nr:uncharacterized protein LCP9604111_65 [Penicillium roqueforti]CDM31782.1 unnamed protein product [Penicillium roqueforti FM164]KAF9252539.1 hypothetical protein LCP9604111_65 [Penicillium roqueforti]KAI1835608.1 hypothetical protein CBS147337_3631 [Penicillium roqueforti]KAI2675540.1 hypothetical protein CBS147355_6534 [Penicillium roqueforti]KAI2687155.1 hypothetical protein LCP963914a_3756 [Penicillium roqueforti]